MKYNPFTPNAIAPSTIFAGREDEIKTIEQCLFQSKAGSPTHFLIKGEKGIGKSSLLALSRVYAEPHYYGINADEDIDNNFIVLNMSLIGVASSVDLIKKLAFEFKNKTEEKKSRYLNKFKKIIAPINEIEIAGVFKISKNSDSNEDSVVEALVFLIVSYFSRKNNPVDGLLMLFDEADKANKNISLGSFLKKISESLIMNNFKNFSIGIAGLPNLMDNLKESHDSSTRMFRIHTIGPLSAEYRKEIIRKGIQIATEKNKKEIEITNEALEKISELSEGYPHFIQQFAHSAFEQDGDNKITLNDVIAGAYKENGALDQLGQTYFEDMYFDQISSNEYREVLKVMSEHDDGWVKKQEIRNRIPEQIKDHTLDNALQSLKRKRIIVNEKGAKGEYRLLTKSFAAWIRAKSTPSSFT